MPIKKLWNTWRAQNDDAPALDDFTAQLLADERFEEMPGVDHTEGLEGLSPDELAEELREMESLGFFSGPRIKLASREITLEHITAMIKKHNDRMQSALHQAHDSMPDDISEQDEGQLLDIMAMAEELRKKLQALGLDMPDGEEETEEDDEADK